MKKILPYLLLIIISISFVGCEEKPVFVKAEDACLPQYKDKKIIIEGELLLPNSFYSTGKFATLVLSTKKGDNTPSVVIYFLKERKNTMERITDGYTMEDIKIYDHEGNNVKLGEKVRLTGKLVGASKAWCELYVDKIEKVK